MSPKPPSGRPIEARAEALAGVLDDGQALAPRVVHDRLDPARPAEDVDRQDGPGPVARRVLDEVRVHAEAVVLDVHEPGDGPLVEQAVGRGDEAEGGRDDLVAVADVQGPNGHVEPGRPARAGHAVAAARELGDALLETLGECAHREDVAGQDLGHELELAGSDVGSGEGHAGADGAAGHPAFECRRIAPPGQATRWRAGDHPIARHAGRALGCGPVASVGRATVDGTSDDGSRHERAQAPPSRGQAGDRPARRDPGPRRALAHPRRDGRGAARHPGPPGLLSPAASRPRRQALHDHQVPHDALAPARRGLVRDRPPAGDPGRAVPASIQSGRAARAVERAAGGDEPRRPAAAPRGVPPELHPGGGAAPRYAPRALPGGPS